MSRARLDGGVADDRGRLAKAILPGELGGEKVGVGGDGGEEVVEVVSHPPREPPEGLHLLRLQKLRFQLLVGGHVDDREEQPGGRAPGSGSH